ncbi:YdcF family protein [Vibrio intestinalis]|uniref:YdcF family protein n=1 Tax=Vibrio intestinalis TaxID=2933291 RepID=UPI0021A83A1E
MTMRLFEHIENLWQYMQLNHHIEKADCIFVLGSNDPRVAEHAVNLYHQGMAEYLIFSGGFGRLTEGVFDQTEAETFAAIAKDLGVPADKIILENQATNSGENVILTAQMLGKLKLDFQRFILVQKPYMERRAYATFMKQWPNAIESATVTSPALSFVDYFNEDIDLCMALEAMLGDFERIKIYPEKGFQIEQPIPGDVEESYQFISLRLSAYR